MNLLTKIKDFLAEVFSRPPYPSPCTGDCNQGRDCDCVGYAPDVNPNWPFPVGPKP